MSRIENAIQVSGHDRWISHQLQRIPCSKCCAVIEYDQGTKWRVVSELVNKHWNACPGKPREMLARIAHTPTSPSDTEIVLRPPATSNQFCSANPVAESVGSQNHSTWISAGCERKRRTLEQRKMELEQDEYAKNVTMKSVVCGGCLREICLDKRSMYYPGLWLKHRGKCPGIEKLERAKARAQQEQNGTRQMSCDAGILTLSDNSDGDVAQPSLVERYESRSAASTRRSVRYDDSEDPSSETEDEEEEVPPQEPFPVLNNKFYMTERHSNRSDEWAYRYATGEEIATNIFRGQDEQYARPDSRPFTSLSSQTGSYCELSRRVFTNRVDRQFRIPTTSRS